MRPISNSKIHLHPGQRDKETARPHANAPHVAGLIRPEELYTLDEIKRRLRITDATLRSARRAGLQVIYKHSRGYLLGAELIRYLTASTTPEQGRRDDA